ncbi:MAG: MBL fold metallo-hydrolase, partial [Mesorhizobium sp.]
DPARTDEELGEIEKLAKDRFAGAFAARDGQTLEYPILSHKAR